MNQKVKVSTKVFGCLFVLATILAGCGGGNNNCNNGGINTSQYGCVTQGSCGSGLYQVNNQCLTSQQVSALSGSSSCQAGLTLQSINNVMECCPANQYPGQYPNQYPGQYSGAGCVPANTGATNGSCPASYSPTQSQYGTMCCLGGQLGPSCMPMGYNGAGGMYGGGVYGGGGMGSCPYGMYPNGTCIL